MLGAAVAGRSRHERLQAPLRLAPGRQPRPHEDVPPEAHLPAARVHHPLPARGEPLLRAREGVRLRLRSSVGSKKAFGRTPVLTRAKALWIEGNPYYERVEGVVAGTPSLSVYDVILDAGSSAKEDPASAVPFDLKLADGRVLGSRAISTTSPRECSGERCPSTRPGRQGRPRRRREGRVRRGASGCGRLQGGGRRIRRSTPGSSTARRARGSRRIRRLHGGGRDGADDERVLRAVEGLPVRARQPARRATRSTSSRASPTSATSSAGSGSSTPGSSPRSRRSTSSRRPRRSASSTACGRSSAKLRKQESSGRRFTPEQADSLGRTAQERATAIAGQVTQAAARLKVKIAQ